MAGWRATVPDELTATLAEHGRRVRPATIRVALVELQSRDLVAGAGKGSQHWTALPAVGDPLLDRADLHGAHDFRHTFATWLEDAGIPARVIDEVMGHEATSRVSAMGAHYWQTFPYRTRRQRCSHEASRALGRAASS